MNLVSDTVGPYQRLELLGHSGMGSVYRAKHLDSGQLVALKTVSVPREAALPALRREIAALARLRHPGVVRILEHGLHDGLPWYAMQLIQADNLSRFCTGQPLTSILGLFHKLCDSLAYLHGEGLVHRDLKPDNILVPRDGNPILVDFGLAVASGSFHSRESLELTGPASGTLAYIAPEQLQGDLVDARVDLYSLGCLLFEALCGRPPFQARRVRDLIHAHLELPPPLPSSLVPGLPPRLDQLVLRLLAKQPHHRLGYASDVAAWLESLGAVAQPPTQAPRTYLYRPAFAGRDQLLADLEPAFQRIASGHGDVFWLGGESGAGKTRLLLELARMAQKRRLGVLSGECQPPANQEAQNSGVPLQALQRPLQSIADRCREWGLDETERLLGPRGKLLAGYEPSLAGLPGQERYPQPGEVPSSQARPRLFRALQDTFAAFASIGPVLFLLDDLQWADDLTFDWLEHALLASSQPLPILWIGAYRSEEISPRLQSFLQRSSSRSTPLRLGQLETSAISSMVGDMLALTPPPQPFIRFLAQHTEGNPFFVAEYLHTAVAEGWLDRDVHGHWQLAGPDHGASLDVSKSLPLPGTIQELILRRLGFLGPQARALVELAALLGREADESLLASLSPTPVFEPLQELLTRQVLRSIAPGRVGFVHDKIREVTEAQIEDGHRPTLHRTIAEILSALPSGHAPENQAELGRHWEGAGFLDLARRCYLEASRYARLRCTFTEALRLLEACLRLGLELTPETVEVNQELGIELCRQGRPTEAAQLYRLALTQAQQIGLPIQEARCKLWLGSVILFEGQYAEAETLFLSALEMGRHLGARWVEARATGFLGIWNHVQGLHESAGHWYEKATPIFRAIDERVWGAVNLSNLALIHTEQGRFEAALACYEEALEMHRGCGDLRSEAITLGNLANLYQDRKDYPAARRLYEQSLVLYPQVEDATLEGTTRMNFALLDAVEGEPHSARLQFAKALELHLQGGEPRMIGSCQVLWSNLERRVGDLAAASRLLREGLDVLERLKDRRELVRAYCQQGHLALAHGQTARAALARAEALASEAGLTFQSSLGENLIRLQQAQTAFEAADTRLFRGELLKSFPEGLHDWLARNGHLPANSSAATEPV